MAAAQSLNASSWVSLDLCEPEHTVSRGDKGDHTILCSLVATEPAATVRVSRAVLPENRFLAALLLTTYELTCSFCASQPSDSCVHRGCNPGATLLCVSVKF